MMRGQNFGSAFTKKEIVLERKLPPTGHIDGTGIKVVVNAGVSYIITHDTDIGTDPNNPDVDSLYATALPMVDLANAVATRVRAERTAIFLDTCFSGNAAQPEKKLMAPDIASGAVAPATVDHIKQGSGRIIFTASGVNEESLESDSIKHGYFSYYLVQALQQQNGAIPLSQAFAFVRQQVHKRAQTEAHAEQNPVLSRSEDSTDFSLGSLSVTQTTVEHTLTPARAE
jgi:uncharacterized caspase-like protein